MRRPFLLFSAVAGLASTLGLTAVAEVSRQDVAGPGVTLGDGWYKSEAYAGRTFRWVDNNASFTVRGSKSLAFVTVRVEGGPGLARTTFPLIVDDASGRQATAVQVTAAQPEQTLILPVKPNEDTRFSLHVEGGGKRTGSDPRTLNFRVFSIAEIGAPAPKVVSAGPEITSAEVRLGDGWYPLEHFKGETFRWVRNDARIVVQSAKSGHAQVKVLVQAGPSLASSPLRLTLRDEKGATVGAASVKDRATTYFTVDLAAGSTAFVLHADDAGDKQAPNDSRVLNFRVFRAAVLR
jgi:hypothetical protein